MSSIRQIRIIKYWLSIISGKKSQMIDIVHNTTLSRLNNVNVVNWASNGRDLLCTTEYGDIYGSIMVQLTRTVFLSLSNVGYMTCTFSSGVVDYMTSQGPVSLEKLYQIANSASLWTRSPWKSMESRLLGWSVVAIDLRVETGRWDRPTVPPQLGLCPVCSIVDDEFHFLFGCKKFVDIHKKLIRSCYWKGSSMYKCVEIFCTRNKKVVWNLAKYLYLSFNTTG